MRKSKRIGGIFVAGFALLVAAVGLTVGSASSPFTFDGAPATPAAMPSVLDGWDVQVHDRDSAEHPGTTGSMVAMHGADCAAPPATHQTSGSTSDAVFQCANHIMTATDSDTTGYSVIYLTPPEMVDFANGGSVSFDLSTLKTSQRDWWDVTVSPFLDAQALPLLSGLSQGVDLQNPNKNSVVITTDTGTGYPHLVVVTNGNDVGYPTDYTPANADIVAGTNQAATRQPFRLTLTQTHVKFERLATATGAAEVFVDQDIPALSWSQGVVQFGHHSYTPTKDGAGTANTWHWDNIAMSPSVPFYIGGFTSKWTQGGTITANAPVPANSYLRFSAICRPVIDGVPATKMTDSGQPAHFSSYMVPVTQGASSWYISFAQDGYYPYGGLHCLAKDYSIFSLNFAGPTPTPTNTSVPPTATNTPIPPTATNTPPPPTATNTPAPATATPTATPVRKTCTLRWGGSTIESYGNLTQAECAARGN